ncbi:unnamed protein product [Phytophthora fragariaefolia]|uniref:Unnamed protein product n=1 Tax=Phytophthora fragariaefolia TaxID=1490495 RepID=A0A9W7D3P6_9STRA|nr:unnamed protein product [Phytophthora fragariaefolia]
MTGAGDYDEARDVCDDGLELHPTDATLRRRRRTLLAVIEREKQQREQQKERREQEERAKVQAAHAAADAAKQPPQPASSKAGKQKLKPRNNAARDPELAPMINHQEVPAKWIEAHARGSKRFESYRAGMERLAEGAQALLTVTDSIGTPGRARLPLGDLVRDGMASLRKAGEAGVAEGWFRLGVLYSSNVRKGMPLTPDPHKMVECLQKAAALRPFIKPPGNRVFPHQGVAEAENELGICYRDGVPAPVVEANPKKAFQYFLRAAEHDCPIGQYNVAMAYSTGWGTPVDAFTARMWTSRAAQHGLPEAQQHLAELFKIGFGGRRDESQAREWSLIASQNRITDLMIKHDFADVGFTVVDGGKIANKFLNNPAVSQRGKEVLRACYGAYLDEDASSDDNLGVDSDGDEIQITKISSYTPSATSSSDHFGRTGIYRPHSAVIDAEIYARAKAGGVVACQYLASEKLVNAVEKLFAAGDIKGVLRDLKKADMLWERPKTVFMTAPSSKDLLRKVLNEAAVSFQINPRDIDAAYAIGRWEMKSDQDAILHWKKCVKMHPNEASFHFYLGTAYLTLERYHDAMDSMEAALTIEKKPDWLYWFAAPMIGLGMIDPAMAVYKEYVETNHPDERFIPDAYYSIGALYFKKYNNAMATVYHELGQMAESVAIRFPAFYPRVLFDKAKETLRSGMKKNGYMESSVIASVMAQNMLECGFCKATIKPTQLLNHKLSKCPRRTVVCEHCDDRMVFDDLQVHRQSLHVAPGVTKKKKGKGKKRAQSAAAKASTPQTPAKTGLSATNISMTRSAILQELTTPKFHFAGGILDITKGTTSNPTVLTLQTAVGQQWTLRVTGSLPPAGSSDLFDVSKAIDGAAVDNSILVFWRRPPPLDAIDRRALTVPMEGEVYGQDVVIYLLKCSGPTLSFELCQLRHIKYMENGLMCAGCGYPGETLLACSACKSVKYCSKNCQRMHWKRIHRLMCQKARLLSHCFTMTEDVTPDEMANSRQTTTEHQQSSSKDENATPSNVRHEDVLYFNNTQEILEDILSVAKSRGNAHNTEDVAEYRVLPPLEPLRDAISGSVRIFRQRGVSTNEFVAEFAVGYLMSSPTLSQQEQLHYFFQIPPHNPLTLKCDGTKVYLRDCIATNDLSSLGFRLMMKMPLAKYSLKAIAELLDYLRAYTNLYVS